jgi:hypothetical protein
MLFTSITLPFVQNNNVHGYIYLFLRASYIKSLQGVWSSGKTLCISFLLDYLGRPGAFYRFFVRET